MRKELSYLIVKLKIYGNIFEKKKFIQKKIISLILDMERTDLSESKY